MFGDREDLMEAWFQLQEHPLKVKTNPNLNLIWMGVKYEFKQVLPFKNAVLPWKSFFFPVMMCSLFCIFLNVLVHTYWKELNDKIILSSNQS